MKTYTTTKFLKQDKQIPQKSYVNKSGGFNYLFIDSVRILNSLTPFSVSALHRCFVLFPNHLLKIRLNINHIQKTTILCRV